MNFFGCLCSSYNSILPTPFVVREDLIINIPFTGRGGARGIYTGGGPGHPRVPPLDPPLIGVW